MENRVRFKIGEIEFEAEGTADIVERERIAFLNALLPAAVDAIERTRGAEKATQYLEAIEQPSVLLTAENTTLSQKDLTENSPSFDYSRTSLASFITNYGKLLDRDFVLIAAYYDEKKNNTVNFSSENVRQYYAEARRTEYSNVSELLKQLAKKGMIMDDPNAIKKTPKCYLLTNDGIKYVELYQPKNGDSERKKSLKPRKIRNQASSIYSALSADDLNLKKYPEIKSQSTFKKQMLLTLYIVTNEGKGESFSVSDIQYLMIDMMGLPASIDQINGVFKNNKSWFKTELDPNNKKACRRKLLQGTKDFVQTIISGTAEQ